MGRHTVAFAFAMMAVFSCSDALPPGAPCFESSECGAAQCIQTTSGRQCMLPCTSEDAVCDEGEACVPAESNADPDTPDLFVCLPGGDIPIGNGCSESIDCVVGSICIERGGETDCLRACTVSTSLPCGAEEQCTQLEGERGFCGDPS